MIFTRKEKNVKIEKSDEEKLEEFVDTGVPNCSLVQLEKGIQGDNKTCNVREASNRLYLDGVPETSKAACCKVKNHSNNFEKVDDKKFDTIHFHRPGNDNQELYDYVFSTDGGVNEFFSGNDLTAKTIGAEDTKLGTGFTGLKGSDKNMISCSDNCGTTCQTDFSIKDNLKTTTLTSASIDNYFSKNSKDKDEDKTDREFLQCKSNSKLSFINEYKDENVINGGAFAKSSTGNSIIGFDSFDNDNTYSQF